MWFYQLKNLRKDPFILAKITAVATGFHLVICALLLCSRYDHVKQPLDLFRRPVAVKVMGYSLPYRMMHQKNVVAHTVPVAAQKEVKAVSRVSKKVAKKKVPALKTPRIGAKSKFVLPPVKEKIKKIETTKSVVNLKEIVKPEPVKEKIPEVKSIEPVPEKVPEMVQPKEVTHVPQLQSEQLEVAWSGEPLPDDPLIPSWFREVRETLSCQIGSFKFFNDITDDFIYTCELIIDAQGNKRISNEAGCTIPVVRAAIKKVYLEYTYPQIMWDKVWPITIDRKTIRP